VYTGYRHIKKSGSLENQDFPTINFIKRETGFEFYPSKKTLIERDFPAHPNLTYSGGYSKLIGIKR
jgi:hypothetical protein